MTLRPGGPLLRPGGPLLRPATAGDLEACADVWRASVDDYGARVGRPPLWAAPGPLVGLLAHVLGTDPAGFLVATRDGAGGDERVVGFAAAIRREHVWFLAMLYVHPDEQARGLGGALLRAVLPPPGTDLVRATCTDAAQPISNALYARHGIVPRIPALELVGRPDPARLAALAAGVRAIPFELLGGGPGGSDEPGGSRAAAPAIPGLGGDAGRRRLEAAVTALDRGSLGYAHPEEHAFLAANGRLGYLYETDGGRIVGYGYTSRSGRLGPVAVEDGTLLPGVLGHLLGAVRPAGAFAAWVPGPAGAAVEALLAAGLRVEDFPALVCWDRPFADFSRYLPIALAVP